MAKKTQSCPDCIDRKSTRLNSSHLVISYAVFCLKKQILPHKDHRGHLIAPTSDPPASSLTNQAPVIRCPQRSFGCVFFFFMDRAPTGTPTLPLRGALPL